MKYLIGKEEPGGKWLLIRENEISTIEVQPGNKWVITFAGINKEMKFNLIAWYTDFVEAMTQLGKRVIE